MQNSGHLLEFKLGDHSFGIDLAQVFRVEHAVEITPVPDAPRFIAGVIDYHGDIIPVFDLRHKLLLPGKELASGMSFILIRTKIRLLAVIADEVRGIVSYKHNEATPSAAIFPSLAAESLVRLDNGIIFLYDTEKFLSAEEAFDLERMLTARKRQKK